MSRQWNDQNQRQPNPGADPAGSPCTGLSSLSRILKPQLNYCSFLAVFAGTRVVTIKREPLSPNSNGDVNVVDDDSNGFASGPTTIVTRSVTQLGTTHNLQCEYSPHLHTYSTGVAGSHPAHACSGHKGGLYIFVDLCTRFCFDSRADPRCMQCLRYKVT